MHVLIPLLAVLAALDGRWPDGRDVALGPLVGAAIGGPFGGPGALVGALVGNGLDKEHAAKSERAPVTVGSKTTVANTEPLTVSGVGLVYRLPGTGSSPTAGELRTTLEHDLKKMPGATDVGKLLDDPKRTTSLVLVSALIPPGARQGDPLDVRIPLPDGSKTTSLQGGELLPCDLTCDTGNDTPCPSDGTGGSRDVRIKAGGPLTVSPRAPTDDRTSDRVGSLAGGGRVIGNRPYHLLLNPNDRNPKTATTVAERLNAAFPATNANLTTAFAETRELILSTRVPRRTS